MRRSPCPAAAAQSAVGSLSKLLSSTPLLHISSSTASPARQAHGVFFALPNEQRGDAFGCQGNTDRSKSLSPVRSAWHAPTPDSTLTSARAGSLAAFGLPCVSLYPDPERRLALELRYCADPEAVRQTIDCFSNSAPAATFTPTGTTLAALPSL